ncbi:DUF2867 domain-containing protein, partial [Mycolicibacterium mucogenicum]|uniref:DUF2867 domain-containing protein n=1 Tax=Mycolicibacterium mucogenicum TaxID=56689 RepID=UPI000A564A75
FPQHIPGIERVQHTGSSPIFFPKGLAGRLYWYALMPFHGIIFTGMIKNIAAEAQKERTRAA